MITFYNGARATIAVTLGISVFRVLVFAFIIAVCRSLGAWASLLGGVFIVWGSPALEGYVLHPLIVAAGMMSCPGCVVHRKDRHGH